MLPVLPRVVVVLGAVVIILASAVIIDEQEPVLSSSSPIEHDDELAVSLIPSSPIITSYTEFPSSSSSDAEADLESGDKTALLPKYVPWYRQAVIFHLIVLHLAMIIIQVPQTPLLGAKSARMGLSSSSMGLILAMMPIANALTSLHIASRMTAWGLKRVLVWGAILMVASGTAFGALDALDSAAFVAVAILLRILGGIGTAANFGATNTFWNTNYENFSMVYAISNASTTMAGVVVPPLGSLISARFGDAASFGTFGAVAALLVAIHSTLITSDLRGPPSGDDHRSPSLLAVGRLPRAMAAGAVVTCNLAVSGLIGVFIPYLFASLSGSEFQTSLMYSAASAFWSFGSLMSGYLLTMRGRSATRLMHQFTALSVLALGALLVGPGAGVVAVSLSILAMATSLSQIAASKVLVDEVSRHEPGLMAVATGFNIAARYVGEALGNIGGGLLYSWGAAPLTALVFGAISALSLLVYELCRWLPDHRTGSDVYDPLLLHESVHRGGAPVPSDDGATGDLSPSSQ